MPQKRNPVPLLRMAGMVEAVSFLVLVLIAMPLKYWWQLPEAVKFFGWIHGILFVVFCMALLRVWIVARWGFGRVVLVFVAALLPFGPFLIDRRVKNYSDEFAKGQIAS